MEPVESCKKMVENVWANREKLPQVSLKYKIAVALVCFLSALAIPFCGSELWSFAFFAVLFAFAAWLLRAPFPLILMLVSSFLVVILGMGFGMGFGVGVLFLSTVLGTVACTYLLTVCKQRYLVLLLPIAAAAVSYIFTSNLSSCLLALAFLPASALLAFATLTARPRTSAICFAAGGWLLTLLILLAVLLYRTYGALSVDVIAQAVEDLRKQACAWLISQRDAALAIFREDTSEYAQSLYTQLTELLSDATIHSSVAMLLNIVPAFAVVICSILGYEAQLLLNASYTASGLRCVVTRGARVFTVSLAASVLYAASFLFVIFLPVGSMAEAVVQNLCLILLPGLCLLGAIRLLAMLSNARGGSRILLILLVLFTALFYPGGALYILAMWGAYSNIVTTIQLKLLEKVLKNRDDHDKKDG